MRILFITDPLETFKTYKDSTYAMMTEAAARGHELYFCLQSQLSLSANVVEAVVRPLDLVDDGKDWFRLGEAALTPLATFDAVLMRKDPPFDMEYVTSTWLLELAEKQGARVFNKPQAIRDHSEKLAIGQFPQFITPTLVTRDAGRIRAFHAEHHDIIVKPLDGMGGMGIFRVKQDALNLGSIVETLNKDGAETIMVQRFVPDVVEGDKRILIIAGEPTPFVLARIPQGTEVRGNLAAGGKGVAQPLTPRNREIAEIVGRALAPRGLLLIGLDVIGDSVTEINVTSPTCFQEITEQTGFDVPAMFIDALEAHLAQAA